MRHLILAAAFLIALTGAAWSDILSYQCLIEGTRTRGWIQPLIFIGHDTESGRVVISDAAILASNDGQPIEGELVADTAALATFRWRADIRSSARLMRRIDYRATYIRATGRITVLAQPAGNARMYNLGGSCDVKKLS